MEKLIELLNEYNWNVLKHSDIWEEKDWKIFLRIDSNHTFGFHIDLYVISKSYWFIQWLVENEKIDFSKVKEKIWLERELYERMLYRYKETDFLIMLLSIENEPIEFLISILK